MVLKEDNFGSAFGCFLVTDDACLLHLAVLLLQSTWHVPSPPHRISQVKLLVTDVLCRQDVYFRL